MSERREQIQKAHPLPKTRRCELLDVARSTAYYRPTPVSDDELRLMRVIDEIHLELPFYGSRRIADELETRGHPAGRKRVQRLMRRMGLRALYPRRRTSQPGHGHTGRPPVGFAAEVRLDLFRCQPHADVARVALGPALGKHVVGYLCDLIEQPLEILFFSHKFSLLQTCQTRFDSTSRS